jgi:ABC-type Fe3+-siderophore transport system permease subunit
MMKDNFISVFHYQKYQLIIIFLLFLHKYYWWFMLFAAFLGTTVNSIIITVIFREEDEERESIRNILDKIAQTLPNLVSFNQPIYIKLRND